MTPVQNIFVMKFLHGDVLKLKYYLTIKNMEWQKGNKTGSLAIF